MARSEQIDGGRRISRGQPQRLAWAVLLVAFSTFCLMVVAVSFSIWTYVTGATVAREATLFADVPAGVTYQPRGSTGFLTVDSGGRSTLGEGDRVRVAAPSSAGYGKVASIELFDGSSLDIRAGSEIILDTYRSSRWSARTQTVNVDQRSGYVRYNLKPEDAFAETIFSIDVGGGVTIDLQPSGSYSIQLRPPLRVMRLANSTTLQSVPDARVEVAVRGQGHATVHGRDRSVQVGPGQLVAVESGTPQQPTQARWSLLRDQVFSNFKEAEYNNTTQLQAAPTLVRADTWTVYGQAPSGELAKEDQGRFGIVRECLNNQSSEDCATVNAAQFIRTGNQTQPFITGITQNLGDLTAVPSGPAGRTPDREATPQREGVDVSEYSSLQLSADLRILNQSLDKGGQAGSECPLLIRIFYKQRKPDDDSRRQEFCFWYKDGPNGTLNANSSGYFESRRIRQYEWTQFRVDLRDSRYIPDGRYLQRIQIEARGHDYNVEVTNVSLSGTQ